jgi:hypothetical protein
LGIQLKDKKRDENLLTVLSFAYDSKVKKVNPYRRLNEYDTRNSLLRISVLMALGIKREQERKREQKR